MPYLVTGTKARLFSRYDFNILLYTKTYDQMFQAGCQAMTCETCSALGFQTIKAFEMIPG